MKNALFALIAAMVSSTVVFAQGRGFALADQAMTQTEALYPLAESNGPWMVKVCSFRGGPGLGFANSVAKELREQHRIDAYLYRFQLQVDGAATSKDYRDDFEKKFQVRPRVPKLVNPPVENWVVLAGNFDSPDSREARATLKKIKRIVPKSVPIEVWADMRFVKNENDTLERPLATAQLIRNPHLPQEKKPDLDPETAKLLIEMNQEEPHSIYNNPAPLTILVQQFGGYSYIEKKEKKNGVFHNPFQPEKSLLNKAGPDAAILTEHLRKLGLEAYVFHGTLASMVCVGGYDQPDEPRLLEDMRRLREMRVGELELKAQVIVTPRRPSLAAR